MNRESGTNTREQHLTLVPPGEILLEEFLRPMEVSQYRLAHDTSVPPRRINEIVHGKRSITADTAIRLGRYFGMDPRFWLNLQVEYDLRRAERDNGARIVSEVSRREPRPTHSELGPRPSEL